VKQVADSESVLRIDAEGKWIDEHDLAFRMNEYDEFAVEQAVLIKERRGGEPDITVLSIGPARAAETIKKALAMGADRGVHVKDDESHQKDPWQIAVAIAAFAKERKFDLILTGMQSQDRGSAQVGVFVAMRLNLPCVTTAVGFVLDDMQAAITRELEGGIRMNVRVSLPAVVTCQLGLNLPRYPTLPNIMKARQKELIVLPIADLLHEDSLTGIERMFRPEKRSGGVVLSGDASAMADQLLSILREKTSVVR
jgi:electron transfer flavoprotein beta subunit